MKIVVTKDDIIQYEATVLDDDLINGGELFIGREDDCHVVLDSQKISRHHAKLQYIDNQLTIEALSRHGGMKLDGREISSAIIQNDSKLEINEYLIHIGEFNNPNSYQVEKTTEFVDQEEAAQPFETTPLAEQLLPVEDTFDDELVDLLPTEQLEDNETGEHEDLMVEVSEEGGDDIEDLERIPEVEEEFVDENLETENVEYPVESDFTEEDNFADDADSFDDEFPNTDESFDDEKTQVVSSFASFDLKIFGEYAPFDTYKLENGETKIGRDEKDCQIILNDPEVSKVHAVIKKSLVECTIEDNDSSNGIILNGERTNKSLLTSGDEFIIGETTFTVAISSDILETERGRLMPVEENQEIIIEDDTPQDMEFGEGEPGSELNFQDNTQVLEEKSFIKRIWKDPKKRIYAIVGILLLVLLLGESPESEPEPDKEGDKKKVVKEKKDDKPKHSAEKLQILEQKYNLALSKFQEAQYYEAKEYIDQVKRIDANYKLTPSLDKSIQDSLDLITRKKEEEALQKEKLLKLKRIKELVDKAKEAVQEKKVEAARSYFASIYELDPENIDVPPLKIEIDSYVAEKERKAQEEALAKAKRKAMLDKLAPGKAEYLKGEWFKASSLLQKFVDDKSIDEDLLKEGTDMLKDSQRKLVEFVEPLMSKARSFKEGQDLKQAYETYGQVLKYDPSSEEALIEREGIFTALEKRSKRIYREALIKEDLSDFINAKEKFQEVQQVSPINSEYYIKATEKLKNYLE